MITGVRRHSHLRGNPSEGHRNLLMDSCFHRNDVEIEASGALTPPKSIILELSAFLHCYEIIRQQHLFKGDLGGSTS